MLKQDVNAQGVQKNTEKKKEQFDWLKRSMQIISSPLTVM